MQKYQRSSLLIKTTSSDALKTQKTPIDSTTDEIDAGYPDSAGPQRSLQNCKRSRTKVSRKFENRTLC